MKGLNEANSSLPSSSYGHIAQAWPIRAGLPHSHSDWFIGKHMTQVKPMTVLSGTFNEAVMM